jgi:hypothetical protein
MRKLVATEGMVEAVITSRILGAMILAAFATGHAIAQSQQDQGAQTQTAASASPAIIGSAQTPQLNPASNPPDRNGKPEQEPPRATDWSTILTAGLLFATLALAFFGLCQVVIMRRTARRQLRAYVFVTTAEIGDIENAQNVRASVSIKNSGQTPAYDLINLGAVTFRDVGLKGDPWPEDRDASLSKSSLGPGEVLWKHFGARPLTSEERAAVRSGTHAVYVYGEILYRDAFGKRRYSRYRFMHLGEAAVRNRQLVVCEEGNEAN